jgi:FixJ family two-component response regulator
MHHPGSEKKVIYVAVVDDDASVCQSFSRVLRAAGFQPIAYDSAEGLLEDAKRPRFDCLVLDIQLGGMSGLELSRRLADVRDFTPVVFVTAYDEPDMRVKALASGCAGYFKKTDPAKLVLECIRRAVGIGPEPTQSGKEQSNGDPR